MEILKEEIRLINEEIENLRDGGDSGGNNEWYLRGYLTGLGKNNLMEDRERCPCFQCVSYRKGYKDGQGDVNFINLYRKT